MREISTLDDLRAEVDRLDRAIVPLLCERLALATRAARFKVNEADVRAPARVEAVIAKVRRLALQLGGDAPAVERVYRVLVAAMIDAEFAHLAEMSRKS